MKLSSRKLIALIFGICMLLTCNTYVVAEETNMNSLPVKDMGGRVFRFGFSSGVNRAEYPDWLLQLEEDYNCTIEIVNVGDRASAAIAIKGGSPLTDVIQMDDTYMYKFIQQKLLLDLNELEYIYPMDTDYYWKNITQATTVGEKVYGVSAMAGDWRRVLVYNRDLINGEDDLQMLAAKGELTWDKLAEILQRVTLSGKAGIAGQMAESDVLETFIVANGGRMFERNGLEFKCVFDSENTRNAIAFVQNLHNNGCIFENIGNYQYPQSQFAKGKIGVYIADGWNMSYIYSKAKFDIGMVLMPMGPDADTTATGLIDYTVFNCHSIPATVENPEDVALIFSAYIKAQAQEGEGKDSWYDTWRDIVDDDENMKVLEMHANAMNEGTCFQDYKNAVTQTMEDGIYDLQQKATNAQISPQAYLESVIRIYEAKAEDFGK